MKKFLDYLAAFVVILVLLSAVGSIIYTIYEIPKPMALVGVFALIGWSFVRVMNNNTENKNKGEDDGNH